MAKLRDVLVYLVSRYPHKHELSKARVTKMVYLADWRSAIEYGRQMTPLRWTFNHYGPYLDDVVDTARTDSAFEVKESANPYGHPKEVIRLVGDARADLTEQEKEVLDHVINETAPLYWNDFIRLVYSTYPVVTQPKYSELDLVGLAREYNATKAPLG